jgi:hypothetical protein
MQLGLVIQTGHSDVGPTGEDCIVLGDVSHAAALQLINDHQQAVISEFVGEVSKIYNGIKEGYLIDDGSEQFVVARLFAKGVDDELVPLSGFSVSCNPAFPQSIAEMDWGDAHWEDQFGAC